MEIVSVTVSSVPELEWIGRSPAGGETDRQVQWPEADVSIFPDPIHDPELVKALLP